VFEVLTRFVREISEVTDETLIISFCVLLIVITSLISYWFYNRRKFRELSHQIPASVLKNYLDSIIQNSNALKSSLFRGGGLEVGEGVPSVFPTGDLPASGVSVSGASNEEINQKNAEIASLTKRLADKDAQIVDINEQLKKAQAGAIPSSGGGEEVAILQSELEQVRAQLAEAQSQPAPAEGGGDTAALEGQLATVTKERDELKERLMEYEIIEEDLANLKRLQQENEQLKATIAQLQGGAAAAPAVAAAAEAPAPEPTPEPEPVAEEPAPAAEVPDEVPAGGDDLEAQMAAAITEGTPADDAPAESEEGIPANEGEQKSAEELLSEFEKMLG